MEQINQQILQEKWAPVLDSEDAGKIQDSHRRQVTAVVLENQERAFAEQAQLTEVAANKTGGGVDNWDPVLISLVRRSNTCLIALSMDQ
jgi:hypothetical protein